MISEKKLKIYKCEFVNNYVSFTKNAIMYDCNAPIRLVYSFEYVGIPLVDNRVKQDYNLSDYVSSYMAYESKPIELEFTQLCEVYDSVKNDKRLSQSTGVFQKRFKLSIELLELIMLNYNE